MNSTLGLTPLVVHVQRGASVHPGHHLEVGAVEAIDADHAGFGIEVAFVGVGGVQVVLEHRQSIQVLNLRTKTDHADYFNRTKEAPSLTLNVHGSCLGRW